MCGIAGIVNFQKQPQKPSILKMLQTIAHRGPDQTGTYIDKNVGLGIQRLSIIDLKSGNQPIHNEDETVTIVFNGEIYNFLHLKELLEIKGHKFKTRSDTEVLVHLYEEYGNEMSKFLRGMFAFAIWDKKKNLLLVSRDQVGIKPLYFFREKSILHFASEIKAILTSNSFKKEINTEAFRAYTLLGYIPGNLSIFKNIFKLLPGHTLIFSKTGLRINKYYNLLEKNNPLVRSVDSYLEDSVIAHSISDVPIGVLLSGGIDSSLIAYYLTKNIKNKINTFSINFNEKSFDESYYAEIVAKKLKTKHHRETFTPKDILTLFPAISEKMDEPLADPSLFPTYKVCKLARKYVKVVLSGDGGDELFGGYPTYSGHLLAEQLKNTLPKSFTNIILNLLNRLPVSFENFPKTEIGKQFLKGIHLSPFKRHLLWMSLKNYNLKIINKDLYNGNLSKDITLLKDLKQVIENSKAKLLTKMQLIDFETYLKDNLLVKVDRASMFNSLEVRVPFLDLDVLEKAFSLNTHVNLFNTKIILRKLIKEKFPAEIFQRRKKGFGIPLSKWINNDLEDFIGDHLQNKKLNIYFNRKEVDRLWTSQIKRQQDNSKLLWMIVMFSGFLNEWS